MRMRIYSFIILLVLVIAAVQINAENYEVLVKVDFEDMSTGIVSGSGFDTDWRLLNPAGQAPSIKEENGNKFLRMDGYSQIISPYTMDSDEYTFETKIRLNKGNRWVGFFFRASEAILRTNPFHSEYSEANPIAMHIHFYESDWYSDAMKKGNSNLGGSGIAVFPRNQYIRIAIKTYISDALNLGVAYHDFNYPDGVDPKSFVKYTVKDNGKDKIEIYVNDVLLTVISFSDVVSYSGDPFDTNEYYSKASMKDSEGNELDLFDSEDRKIETLDNARIARESHLIAFASRTESFDIDDIQISVKGEEATEAPTKTPGTATKEPSKATPVPAVKKDQNVDWVNLGIAAGALVITAACVGYIVISFRKKQGGKVNV